jgi:hypothetical protein
LQRVRDELLLMRDRIEHAEFAPSYNG